MGSRRQHYRTVRRRRLRCSARTPPRLPHRRATRGGSCRPHRGRSGSRAALPRPGPPPPRFRARSARSRAGGTRRGPARSEGGRLVGRPHRKRPHRRWIGDRFRMHGGVRRPLLAHRRQRAGGAGDGTQGSGRRPGVGTQAREQANPQVPAWYVALWAHGWGPDISGDGLPVRRDPGLATRVSCRFRR
jgi:hypothetical protein